MRRSRLWLAAGAEEAGCVIARGAEMGWDQPSDQLTTHYHGEADHLAWLERPFAEALRALEERGGK
jgi:hypothetical protein